MNEFLTISRIAAIPLAGILWSCIWGLNEIRKFTGEYPVAFNWHTGKDFALAASYIALGCASGLMLWGIFNGIEVITWRGLLLVAGIFGIFLFFGKFRPWAKWIKRTVPVDRHWADKSHPTAQELAALSHELRMAFLNGPAECLRVMPKAIAAIETLAAERPEIERLRADMVSIVSELRYRLNASTLDPVTAAHIADVLDQLDQAVRSMHD